MYRDKRSGGAMKRLLAMLVCMIMMLSICAPVLPVMAAEESVPCSLAEHIHGDGCYVGDFHSWLWCGGIDSETVIHTHRDLCYTAESVLLCSLPEREEHTHEDSCYDPETQELVCEKEEIVLHEHGDECWEMRQGSEAYPVLICPLPVVTEHIHAEACLKTEATQELICTLTEHTHGERCVAEPPAAEDESPDGSSLPQGDKAATLNLNVWAYAKNQVIPFSGGNDVSCTIGSAVTFVLRDTAGTYATHALNFNGCELVSVEHTCDQGTNVHKSGDWCNHNPVYTFTVCVTSENASVRGDIGWLYDGNNTYSAIGAQTPESPEVNEEAAEIELPLVCTVEEHIHAAACIPEGAAEPVCGKAEHSHVLKECYEPAKADYTYEDDFVSMTVHVVNWAPLPEGLSLQVGNLAANSTAYGSYEAYAKQSGLIDLSGYVIGFTDGDTPVELPDTQIRVSLTINPVNYIEAFAEKASAMPKLFSRAADSKDTSSSDDAAADNGIIVTVLQDSENGVASEGQLVFSEGDTKSGTMEFSLGNSRTLALAMSRAITSNYRQVSINGLDTSGRTKYVVYTRHSDGKYYAFNGNGDPVEITVNENGTITCDDGGMLLWTFSGSGGTYRIYNQSANRYMHAYGNADGVTTTGDYTSGVIIGVDENGKMFFRVKSNNEFAHLTTRQNVLDFRVTTDVNQAAKYYLAARIESSNTCHVWFDGTNGTLMGLHGAGQTYQAVRAGTTITLPSQAWSDANAPTKYPYTLDGWYDINTYTYYEPGAQVTIYESTVFYADWVAKSYDVGVANDHVVNTINTNDFIDTYVFDYTSLFNVQSVYHTGSVNASGHTESWTILNNGKVPYNNGQNTLGFMFVDYDGNGEFSYAYDRDNTNINQGDAITAGIIDEVRNASGGKDLMDILFDKDTPVIGKKYIGMGNHLFQYMDSTTPNYDGEHDGYYYLDARRNAASYNRSAQRFYVYDYLERTSDSRKDGGVGEYSDLLPFNSPYQFRPDQLENYVDTIMRPGYEYDAKDSYSENGTVFSSYDDATTNYWFGIRSDIRFFLPNVCGEAGKDEYDNYGNISTRGEHMVFDFHGDDDVWVFVDGELVLDIGGLHGVMFGQIDFSTGTVITGKDGGATTTRTFEEILGHNILSGEHTLTVYYMERGSSQSNCAIYFNIAPRYDLEITKEDIFTSEKLNGAVFSVYNDEACTDPAQLWPSRQAYLDKQPFTHQFTVVDGVAKCWGIAAGKTYYIKETTPPQVYDPPYPVVDDILRVTLNNRGTATIETTRLNGEDGEESEGYAVIKQNVNNTLKIVSLTVSNQRNMETTELRVKKVWDANATDLPNSLTVYLTVNGERVGRDAVLSESNGWTYVWEGLPKYEADGQTLVQYEVEEVQVPGFTTGSKVYTNVADYVDWTKTDAMADSSTYLLVNSERALAYNGSAFYWMDLNTAKNDATGKDAQWLVTTNQYGFRLRNGNGYNLTYNYSPNANNDSFSGNTSTESALNQVIYYLDNRLVAHSHDKYFQFGLNGTAVDSDGLVFTLQRKDLVRGHVVELENKLVDNDEQTFVEVTKRWADDKEHSGDFVIVHLYANGKDTGITMALNKGNNWFGRFEGLAAFDEQGNKITYTVVEEEMDGYVAEYETTTIPGRTTVTWVKAESFTANERYRIFTGAKALELDGSNTLVIGVNDASNTRQWWVPENHRGNTILKSYAGNYYLRSDGTNAVITTNRNNASAVQIVGDDLKLGDGFVVMTSSSISVSSSEFNATAFSIARRTEDQGQPGLGVTVVNHEGYSLPETGGPGTHLYHFSGLLLTAAALVYGFALRRRNRKEADV